MNFEVLNNNAEKIKLSEDVETQLENLGLKPEDVQGRVLDIGANEAQFATELKKVTDAEIISIDNSKGEYTPDNVIIADARKLPFEDSSFDRVVSHASIPNVFIGMYSEEFPELSKEEIKNSISKVFNEILRVLKTGSSAVMAPVRIADNYNSEKALVSVLREVVGEIEGEGVEMGFDLIKEVENPQNKEKHKEYRLTLLKK
ncbi:MAG: ubiquinone/menaquinone biosynthesis C-methylase UbiE [Candidatus Paceibacteria bacterium]|jgi:ubiquinone/menaquinone biosynthesis C-methylase UbiE